MYQVLYRKWRPGIFDDVSGQPYVTETLKNQIKSDRFGHAYLFTGSRGTGKTTCAKILAKAVNCLSPKNGNPCCECENCIAAENGTLLDIVEMDAASNRRIDDIRNVIDEAAFNPAKGKFRVYIIDEVHMLTKEAFNALLKTLEEPPKHVIFILATTEVNQLPATILSRCQRFDFNRIKPQDIADRLHFVAQQENVRLDDDAAMLIASVADGALRDALSLLDRCIGLCENVDIQTVRSAAGLAQKDYIFKLSDSCINKNCCAALDIINELYNKSKSMPKLCEELTEHFRALMLIQAVKNPRQIVFMTDAEYEHALQQCKYLTLNDIIYFIDVLSRAQERMGRGNNNRVEFESAMVRLCAPELDFTKEALLDRISALEKQVRLLSAGAVNTGRTGEAPASETAEKTEKPKREEKPEAPIKSEVTALNHFETPQKEPAEPAVQKPLPAPAKNRTKVDMETLLKNAVVFPLWPEIIEEIAVYSKTVASALKGSSAYTSGNYLLIDTDNDIAYELLKNSAQKESIRNVVYEKTGIKYSMGPYKKRNTETPKNDAVGDLINTLRTNGVNVTEF